MIISGHTNAERSLNYIIAHKDNYFEVLSKRLNFVSNSKKLESFEKINVQEGAKALFYAKPSNLLIKYNVVEFGGFYYRLIKPMNISDTLRQSILDKCLDYHRTDGFGMDKNLLIHKCLVNRDFINKNPEIGELFKIPYFA